MTNRIFNTITAISVGRAEENPIFGECIRIRLEDECGGMFLVLEQDGTDDKIHQVRIGFDEWNNIIDAIHLLTTQTLVK